MKTLQHLFIKNGVLYFSIGVVGLFLANFDGMAGKVSAARRLLFWFIMATVSFINSALCTKSRRVLTILIALLWTFPSMVVSYFLILGEFPPYGRVALIVVIAMLIPLEILGEIIRYVVSRNKKQHQ